MYQLQVFYPGDPVADVTRRLDSAGEVLAAIPVLLSEHPGCEKIVVTVGDRRLFALDCAGARIPD